MQPDMQFFGIARSFVLIFSLFALSSCGTAITADLETGLEASKKGNIVVAEQNLVPLADYGLPEAQFELAQIYVRLQNPTAEQLSKARDLFSKVTGEREARAAFELGRMYEKGLGGVQSNDRALEYYQKSAELGYARAYFQIASLFEKEKDYDRAELFYKKAFHDKYYDAAERIGRLYEKGKGRQKDLAVALFWYTQAHEHGVEGLGVKIKGLSSIK